MLVLPVHLKEKGLESFRDFQHVTGDVKKRFWYVSFAGVCFLSKSAQDSKRKRVIRQIVRITQNSVGMGHLFGVHYYEKDQVGNRCIRSVLTAA